MTFYDKLQENLDDKEELTRILLEFDYMLRYLHNNGFCVYDFDPKKIILENGKLTLNSFKNVLNDLWVYKNMKAINIYQLSKIGLMSYNNYVSDGKMNQEHFDFIKENLEKFNEHGLIPEEIYEYYEEIFRRLNITYMNDYLIKKQQEASSNQNTNVMRKSLSTPIGRAYVPDDDAAYVNVLFIPAILALGYLVSLFIYVFIIR